jgi:hypothetical protein
MWGDLSDERTGLSFARVTVSSNKSVSMYSTIYILHVLVCIYNIYEYKASVSSGSVQQIMPYH